MNLTNQKQTSSCREAKKWLMNCIKTTIQQLYPNTVVDLKVQRKGVKTTIRVWGTTSTGSIEKLIRAYDETHDLLKKNGFILYQLKADYTI